MLNRFYEELLGLDENWRVKGVEKNDEVREVTVKVEYANGKYRCPQCLEQYSTITVNGRCGTWTRASTART